MLAELLAEHTDGLRPGHHARATSLIRQIEDQRAADRTTLLEAMSSTRYSALLDRLVEGARSPRLRTPETDSKTKVDKVAARLIRKPWKRLRDQVRRLAADPPDQELHEVRKSAKKARYALEAVAPATGKQAGRAAKRLAALQDTLGDHQDAVVAAEWIERAALRSNDDVDTAFVAGELAASFAADRRELRQAWPDEWKRARRRVPALPW